MANRKKVFFITAIAVIIGFGTIMVTMTMCASAGGLNSLQTAQEQELTGRRLEISFSYANVRRIASSQFAFWIEDLNGNYIDTLYVTQWTAQGGYKRRPTPVFSPPDTRFHNMITNVRVAYMPN